jgi:hypothetical protein
MGVASFANGLQLSAKATVPGKGMDLVTMVFESSKKHGKIWKHEWFVAVNRC